MNIVEYKIKNQKLFNNFDCFKILLFKSQKYLIMKDIKKTQ